MRPKDVVALGKEAEFTQGVIYRARKELEGAVVNTEGKMSPNNRWMLADSLAGAGRGPRTRGREPNVPGPFEMRWLPRLEGAS